MRKKIINFFYTKKGASLLFLSLFLFLLLLELNFVGLLIRDKISIDSTLDFSWFSDAIERYLHGYVLGRDFTFTYGPLFQFIYSFPSIFFHMPSYISVAIAPVISYVLVFTLVFIIAKYLTKNIFVQISYVLFVFLILGLLISSGVDTVKMLVPMVYSLILFDTLERKFQWVRVSVIAILPSIFGLYTYNLFITTSIIALFLIVFILLKKKKKVEKKYFFLIIPLIVCFQILVSLLFTHNLDYIFYSFDSISNYRYVLDLAWTADRINILLIFPIILPFLGFYLYKAKRISAQTNILFLLIFASFVELIYALSRSDAGHLLWAFYPSIITLFSIIFFVGPKAKELIALGFILYLLVPFKPTFYNTFSPKNIYTVFKIIHEKPAFFSLYKLPEQYFYSEKEINDITYFVEEHKNNVYIYPYDSYILNIENTTYNSFALGMYTYSNSPVEANTVNEFLKNPPAFIILGVDTKGALNLDDIPNFTRNPILAEWMIKNYDVKKQTPKYFILSYEHGKPLKNNFCRITALTVDLTKKENIFQRVEDIVKPPIFYLGDIRLPYSPSTKDYLLFQNINTDRGLSALFENKNDNKTNNLLTIYKNSLSITRVDPFLQKKQLKQFNSTEYSLKCINL